MFLKKKAIIQLIKLNIKFFLVLSILFLQGKAGAFPERELPLVSSSQMQKILKPDTINNKKTIEFKSKKERQPLLFDKKTEKKILLTLDIEVY